MRVGAHVAVMFDAPVDAVLGRAFDDSRRGDAVDGHIRVVVQPGAVDMRVGGILARAQGELGEHTLLAVSLVHQQHGALLANVVKDHFLTWERVSPLRGIPVGRHKLTRMLVDFQHDRQIIHGGTTEPTFGSGFAQPFHLNSTVYLSQAFQPSKLPRPPHRHGNAHTRRRSNGSELMPSSRICLAHSLAVNRLWSR